MKYTVNMSQEILNRYALLFSKLTGAEEMQNIIAEDIKEFSFKAGPIAFYVLPDSNKTVTVEITVKDEFILDMLDIADKYIAPIRKITSSIKMFGEGMLEMTSVKKELTAAFKKYED